MAQPNQAISSCLGNYSSHQPYDRIFHVAPGSLLVIQMFSAMPLTSDKTLKNSSFYPFTRFNLNMFLCIYHNYFFFILEIKKLTCTEVTYFEGREKAIIITIIPTINPGSLANSGVNPIRTITKFFTLIRPQGIISSCQSGEQERLQGGSVPHCTDSLYCNSPVFCVKKEINNVSLGLN